MDALSFCRQTKQFGDGGKSILLCPLGERTVLLIGLALAGEGFFKIFKGR